MLWRKLVSLPVILIAGIYLSGLAGPPAAQQTPLTRDSTAELSDEQVRRLLLEKLAVETGNSASGHGDAHHPAVIAYRLQNAFGTY